MSGIIKIFRIESSNSTKVNRKRSKRIILGIASPLQDLDDVEDQCALCGKEFTGKNRRNNLVRHVKTHTGEKPFSCPCCSYRATRKEHMIRHLRKGSCVYHRCRIEGQTQDVSDSRVQSIVNMYLAQLTSTSGNTSATSYNIHSSVEFLN